MPRVRYIGTEDPTDSDVCEVFGLAFPKGKLVTVEGSVAEKLSSNPTFAIGRGSASTDEPAAEAAGDEQN